jgi:hypothetical protein
MKLLPWAFSHGRTERRSRPRRRAVPPRPPSVAPVQRGRGRSWAFPRTFTAAPPKRPDEREAEAVAIAAVAAAPSVPSRRPMRFPRADEPAMDEAEVRERADDFTRWRARHAQLHRQR